MAKQSGLMVNNHGDYQRLIKRMVWRSQSTDVTICDVGTMTSVTVLWETEAILFFLPRILVSIYQKFSKIKILKFYLCVVPIFPRHLESTRSNSALNYSPVFSARGESAHGTCDDVTATVPSATASRHWSARISDITWNLSADWLAAFPASHSTGATIGLRWTADVTSCWVPFAPWVVYREHVWDGAPQSKVVARCGQSECFRNSEGPVVCKLGQSVAYYYAACFFPSG